MKKLVSLIVFTLLVSGCNSNFTFSEIEVDNVNSNVREFIKHVEPENGNYLYLDGKKGMYVFLNGKYVKQGSDAVYFSDFNVNAQQGTLNVFFNQEYDSDYSNKNLRYQVLYKIETEAVYDTIKLFSNGKPISFDIIAVNE